MQKKFRCIAKVGNDKFVKHRVNNLVSYANYLDKAFPDWRWFNVYHNETRQQIANFTKNNRPDNKWLQ